MRLRATPFNRDVTVIVELEFGVPWFHSDTFQSWCEIITYACITCVRPHGHTHLAERASEKEQGCAYLLNVELESERMVFREERGEGSTTIREARAAGVTHIREKGAEGWTNQHEERDERLTKHREP